MLIYFSLSQTNGQRYGSLWALWVIFVSVSLRRNKAAIVNVMLNVMSEWEQQPVLLLHWKRNDGCFLKWSIPIQAIPWHFTMDRFNQRLQSRSLNTGIKHSIQFGLCSLFSFIHSRPPSLAMWIERLNKKGMLIFKLIPWAKTFWQIYLILQLYVDSHSHNRVLSIVR